MRLAPMLQKLYAPNHMLCLAPSVLLQYIFSQLNFFRRGREALVA